MWLRGADVEKAPVGEQVFLSKRDVKTVQPLSG